MVQEVRFWASSLKKEFFLYLTKKLLKVPSHHTAIGANSLEHNERYDIVTDEEWYILVKVGET